MADSGYIDEWEPSYRLKPGVKETFQPAKVRPIVEEELQRFEDVVWDAERCQELCAEVCQGVQKRVRSKVDLWGSWMVVLCVCAHFFCFVSVEEVNIPRYKLVVQAVVGQVLGQGAYTASRCLWDSSVDNYVSCQFRNVCSSALPFFSLCSMAHTPPLLDRNPRSAW